MVSSRRVLTAAALFAGLHKPGRDSQARAWRCARHVRPRPPAAAGRRLCQRGGVSVCCRACVCAHVWDVPFLSSWLHLASCLALLSLLLHVSTLFHHVCCFLTARRHFGRAAEMVAGRKELAYVGEMNDGFLAMAKSALVWPVCSSLPCAYHGVHFYQFCGLMVSHRSLLVCFC